MLAISNETTDVASTSNETNNINKREPKIAVHTLKFMNMGALIDVDELWTMNSFVSFSSVNLLKSERFGSRGSTLVFEKNNNVNEILNNLKYFSQDIPGGSTNKKKIPKDAYSWGGVGHCMFKYKDE